MTLHCPQRNTAEIHEPDTTSATFGLSLYWDLLLGNALVDPRLFCSDTSFSKLSLFYVGDGGLKR